MIDRHTSKMRGEQALDATKAFAVLLVVGGILVLIYGGFSSTNETQAANIGPVELKVTDTKNVNIPVWVGIATIVAGGSIMLARR